MIFSSTIFTLKSIVAVQYSHDGRLLQETFSRPLSVIRSELVTNARAKITVTDPDTGNVVQGATYEWAHPPPDTGLEYDCSGFTLSMVKDTLGYDPFGGERFASGDFRNDLETSGSKLADCSEAKPGDIILWDGHIGIIADPQAGTFVGAQAEKVGITEASFTTGYWSKGKTCYTNQYIVTGSAPG